MALGPIDAELSCREGSESQNVERPLDRPLRTPKKSVLARKTSRHGHRSSPSLQVCSTAMYCRHFHARMMPEVIAALHRHGGA